MWFLIGVLTGQVAAATPAGGAIIHNRAEASYIPQGEMTSETIYSNTVEVKVQGIEALTLTQNQTVSLPPGATAVLPHMLANTGNITSTYIFALSNTTGDSYDLSSLRLVHDRNNNGVFDNTIDAVIKLNDPSASITLAAGESVSLLAIGQVPATQTIGLARILLRVKTVSAAASGSNADVIKVTDAAMMSLVKKADQAGPVKQNQKVRYTVTATNIGSQSARPASGTGSAATPVKLDSVPTSLILIRDAIPAGTTFAGGLTASNPNALKMYRVQGALPYEYQTTFTEQSRVIEVAIGLTAQLDANVLVSMAFDVKVASNAAPKIINSGFIIFNNGSDNVSTESNSVALAIAADNLAIGVAKKAGTVMANQDAEGRFDGTYTVPLIFTVKNYGDVPLYDVQVKDLLEGDKRFGAYIDKPVPGRGQYTVVASTGRVVTPNQGARAAFNNHFTGQAAAQNILAPNAMLPVGGTLTVQFSVRLFPADDVRTILNTATASAANEPAGASTVIDDSVSGLDPDPDGNAQPSEKSPTPIELSDAAAPMLSMNETVGLPRKVAPDTYELDYTIKVKNIGKADATFLRVADNLDCAFEMDRLNGPVQSWELLGPPVMQNGLLVSAGSAYKGFVARNGNRGVCDRTQLAQTNAELGFPNSQQLSLSDGSRSLKPGEEEVITFTVRLVRNLVAAKNSETFINKAFSAAFDTNSVNGATIIAASAVAANVPLIDPQGVLYDAANPEKLIAGAKVTLVREQCTGGPTPDFTPDQLQFGSDSRYTVESRNAISMITGADGAYFFVLNSASMPLDCDYSLDVAAPDGYKFQSVIAPRAGIAPAGLVQPQDGPPADPAAAPYYLKFRLGPGYGSVFHNHIPLDPSVRSGVQLFLRKAASKAIVELGDFLDYTIILTNQTASPVTGYSIIDSLPAGFAYEPGSTLIDDRRAADPEGGRGPVITWTDPGKTIPVGGSVELTYRVRVGVGAVQGDGINHAIASSDSMRSQEALARVKVTGGVFSDEGFIIGKVFMDCNADRIQGPGEVGVPGVRIFLEDGTYIISDLEGKYSFYGIKPVTHVLKLDSTTLPRGAKLIPLSNRNSGKGDSQFVDLKKGELHKADFALYNGHSTAEQGACEKDPVLDEVERRRTALMERPDAETDYVLRTRLDAQGKPINPGDIRGLPASGLVGQLPGAVNGTQTVGDAQAFTSVMPRDLNVVRPLALPDVPVSPVPTVKLEDQIASLDNKLDFVDLKDNDTLPIDQANIQVKGALGASFRLTVNGKEISEKRVGKRSRLADRQLEAWEFIGVSLNPGSNTLKLEQIDIAGNPRGEKTIAVIAPDALGKLELDLPAIAIADGNTPIRMKLRLTDNKGVPVTVRTQVTLETDQGRWVTSDLNQAEPGTQIFVQGGTSEVVLMPPSEPSDGIIRISAGIIEREVKIAYLPELRPLVGAGILEGVLNLRRLGSGSLTTAGPNDAFEKELSHWSVSSDDNKTTARGRAAFFFKGSVLGKYLLTTAYDSDKGTQERLFRDIQPDQFYPIYGDSATKGFDAQSTSRLYVRVDKDKSYLLYGDYTTAGNTDVRQLTQYSRSLTGVKGHYEDEIFNVTGFYSDNGSTQIVEEFPANGTSGPYELASGGNIIENSEKVEVLVRDRNQPSIVLASSTQVRFIDYNLDPLTKRLLFRGPVPSVDANLNRQYIRVTYETGANGVGGAGGGPKFGVGGVDAQIKVTDNIQLGVIGIKDDNPINRSTLLGATVVGKLGEKTVVNGELAHSDTDLNGSGEAERIEIRHEQGDLKARAQFTRTDKNFSNQSAYSTAGRTEAPAIVEYKLTADTKLRGEGLYSKDDVNGGVRKGVVANVVQRLGEGMEGELGMRASVDTGVLGGSSCVTNLTYTTANCAPTALTKLGDSIRNELLTVRGKFTSQIPWVTGLQAYIEAEQDVRDIHKHLFAIGANYQLSEKTRLFGRYELASTLGSQFNLNSFAPNNTVVIGIESAYMKGGNMYNEYRLRDSQSGREAQAALGVRNTWMISEGLRVGGGFETTQTFNGLPGNNSNALVGTVEYFANPRYRTSASLELRKADTSDSLLNTLGLSYKLSKDWSFLGRTIFSYMDSKSAGKTIQTRQQVGFAYREVDQNVWNLLGRYEHKYEDITGSPADSSTRMHIVSTHANYQANADIILSGRYAGKVVTSNKALTDSYVLDSLYWAQLLYGRATWDFIKDWDASLQTGIYVGKGGAAQYAIGAEIGYQVVENLWLSAGYNLRGVSDPDLTANDYLDPGIYVRARFKFDENTLSW
jgi:uncharacterized repeat protein (TIGR01451 family)